MAKKVLIEVLDKQGVWIHYQMVANYPARIEKALQEALKTQLASKSKKARALDADTNNLLKIKNG